LLFCDRPGAQIPRGQTIPTSTQNCAALALLSRRWSRVPAIKVQIKYSLYSIYTLSGVMSERYPFLRLCARAHNQGCSGGESSATCGRFNRLEIWISYLLHQRQTSCHLRYLAIMCETLCEKFWDCLMIILE